MAKLGIQILLADDDIDDCELFNAALNTFEENHLLTIKHDGNQLIQYLKNCTTASIPAIIFLDLNMPCKNGRECLTELKKNEQWKDIPVIIFSTSLDMQAVNQAYKDGVKHYICKPNSFDKIKKVIQLAVSSVFETKSATVSVEKFILKP